MAKYTQEVKDKAVIAAKDGKSLKEIQQTIGPNPLAVKRYLKKLGIEYKELKTVLKETGQMKETYNKNPSAKAVEQKHPSQLQKPGIVTAQKK